MRSRLLLVVLLGSLLCGSALSQATCDPAALPKAAHEAAAAQKLLGIAGVPEDDPRVPPGVAAQLLALKAALERSALAAFACTPAGTEPEAIEKTLTEALHTRPAGAESIIETRGKRDVGTYGADLSVQVFPLGGSPPYLEVDFRYGVECGDDNLLLVFGAGTPKDASPWHQVLRWDTPRYATVADAFGDFIMMTPLSGFPGQRNWRFVVAHGMPGCEAADARSAFALDLLEPTADPAHPTVVWHLQQPYRREEQPRLSTTEDTLTFELSEPSGTTAKSPKAAKVPTHVDTFRYRVTRDNHVQPLSAVETEAGSSSVPTPSATPGANTHSPQ